MQLHLLQKLITHSSVTTQFKLLRLLSPSRSACVVRNNRWTNLSSELRLRFPKAEIKFKNIVCKLQVVVEENVFLQNRCSHCSAFRISVNLQQGQCSKGMDCLLKSNPNLKITVNNSFALCLVYQCLQALVDLETFFWESIQEKIRVQDLIFSLSNHQTMEKVFLIHEKSLENERANLPNMVSDLSTFTKASLSEISKSTPRRDQRKLFIPTLIWFFVEHNGDIAKAFLKEFWYGLIN